MKGILNTLSLYCQGANGKVVSILESLPEDQLKKDMHTYYKSIFDTFVHTTMADLNWFMRFKNLFPDSKLSKIEFLQTTISALQDRVAKNYQEIFSIRKTTDQLFLDFIDELSKDDFDKVINYKNKAGVELSNKVGHILLHLFNHQTHHRGSISALLDILGVDNDYSGLFKYIKG